MRLHNELDLLFFFVSNKRRLQRQITLLVMFENLASSPASPNHLFDLGASFWINIDVYYQRCTFVYLPQRTEIKPFGKWLAWGAISGTSCVLPDVVYLSLCVHCFHLLVLQSVSSSVSRGGVSAGGGSCGLLIDVLAVPSHSANIYVLSFKKKCSC